MTLPYKSLLAQCAETALVDEQTRSLSLINIIEEIAAPTFPVVLARAVFVFAFARDNGASMPTSTRIEVRSGGQELIGTDFPTTFVDAPRGRVLIQVGNLRLPGPAPIEATLFLNGERFESITVPVSQRTLAAPQANVTLPS